MNEREALLRAVCENPDDDTPRLVFADWLDEHDEPERAEFIRLQIKLARGSDDPRLKLREQELLTAHRAAWSEPFRQFDSEDPSERFFYGVQFRRGFVYALTLDNEEQQFAEHAAAFFRLAPIQRINLFGTEQNDALSKCSEMLRVKELMFDRGDGFSAPGLRELLRSKYLLNLVRLDLIADDDNGHLAPDSLEVLGRTKSLPALRYLDLSYNCLWWYTEEATTWVRRLTKGNLIGQLETLRLRGTDLGDEGAQILARCKRVGSLTHLDLSGNSISPVGLRTLARSPNLKRLKTLDLRGNHYDPDDIQARECPPELRTVLEDRFGRGVLLDGKRDPHPHDVLFKEFK